MKIKEMIKILTKATFGLLVASSTLVFAEESQSDYYTIHNIEAPSGIVPEVGGIEIGPKGELYVSTRRGNIHHITNYGPGQKPVWKLWAQGLHEPLGIAWKDGWLYATQRPEVTKIKDKDGDNRADIFRTISDRWGINGDYHEYAFGTSHDKSDNIWVVLCLTGSGGYSSDFRGWAMKVTPRGKAIPIASGIRSPGGIGFNDAGDVFYCDNQGLWNGSSSLKHLAPGSFQGNPTGWKAYEDLSDSLLGGRPVQPESKSRVSTELKKISSFVPPAAVLPHGRMGQSPTGIIPFPKDGSFGPYEGQLMVGEQTYSEIQRVYLEQVNGVYQGAAFHFLSGFGSGNIALKMSEDGVLITGGSNRGWGAKGGKTFALESVHWNGKVPFEVQKMNALNDGFKLTFTHKVDPKTAGSLDSYKMEAFTYIYQSGYGSPEVDKLEPKVTGAKVSEDGMSVVLTVDKLTEGHVHELAMDGVKSAAGKPLLHAKAYYTLNEIPSPNSIR